MGELIGLVQRKKMDKGRIPGEPHTGAQQDVRVCYIP